MAEELTQAIREHERATMTEVREELRRTNDLLEKLNELLADWYLEWDDVRLKGPK